MHWKQVFDNLSINFHVQGSRNVSLAKEHNKNINDNPVILEYIFPMMESGAVVTIQVVINSKTYQYAGEEKLHIV